MPNCQKSLILFDNSVRKRRIVCISNLNEKNKSNSSLKDNLYYSRCYYKISWINYNIITTYVILNERPASKNTDTGR